MKNSKLIKILCTVVSLVLIVLAIGVIAGAEGSEELSVKINARNVSYGDLVKVLFAVDDTNAGGNEVEVFYYLEDPTVNPDAEAFTGVKYSKGYTDKNGTEDDTSDDVNYPAFYTAGFPAKEIGKYVYAIAHIKGTEIYSEIERYSVVEYLLERLYVENATGDKQVLYETLLKYGAYAQKVILNGNDDPDDNVTQFVTDYVLVAISGGTLDGKYSQGTYFVGDPIRPQADGVSAWKVTTYDPTTGAPSEQTVANGDEIAVAGFTVITESEEEIVEPYKPDLTDTKGRILWNEASTMDAYKSAGYLDYWAGGGGTFAFVDESPYGVASKVLKLSTINGANQDQLMIRNTLAYANSTFAKFEADILVNPVQNTTLELRFMNNTLASADRTAYTFYLNVGADGNGSITGSGINTVEASAVAGNWFRFRAEYHDVSETQFKILIYYNDMLVAGTDAINKPKGADHASSLINQVLVASSSTSVADIYLDNVKLSHDAPAYTPDLSDTAGRETYEPGDSIDAFTYDLWVNNAGTPLPTIEAAPYGVSSYVSFADNSARAYLNIGFKKTASTTAKMYRFETDMMITNAAANALIKGDIGGDKVKFALSVSGNTITLNSQQNNSSPISVVAPTGEWFRFTVECYVDASGNNVVRYLINEQQVGTTYASTVPLSGEHRIRFIADANKGADIYFDNTKVEFVTE